uniref:fibronectin type III domain-containing protein n=3 Tax=Winogradskyella sp. TaxID=1883156 RepID=UPI00355968F6
MKKITLFLLLLCLSLTLSAQVLNQSAAWPNTDWTVTGTYNADPTAFEADPTATSNFAFDDDDAGFGSDDDIAAESPAIDLTAAFTAGETWLFVDVDYTYNDLGDVLNLEYWDADSNTWEVWQQFMATAVQPTDNFCNGARDSFTSNQLNIAGFTATQLSGFQYRIAFYDDGPGGAAGYEWGFCFDAPTISSQAPPTCPDPEMLSAANSTASSGELSWTETGTATIWNIEVVIAGNAPTGTPTDVAATNPYIATGLSASTNYEFYVQSDCGGGDVSNWIGPFAFATECATFTAPFSEDFENGGTIPLCWTMDGGEDWQFSDTGAGNHIGDNGTITGSTASNNYFAWVDSSGNDGPSTLTSPLIDVSGLTNPALSFYELSDNE